MQEENKCWADSTCPQLAVQKLATTKITPRFMEFNLVGNLSRLRLQAKIETFKGT